jgi:CRP-like cAMP-binding protein
MALHKDAKVEMIRRVPLFGGCGKRDLRAIADIADEISLPQGERIAKQGERGREFFVVIDGAAEVAIDGKKVAELGPGDFFGEMALVSDQPRVATVTAGTPVRLLVIVDRAFARLLREDSGIQTKILSAVADRTAANEAQRSAAL